MSRSRLPYKFNRVGEFPFDKAEAGEENAGDGTGGLELSAEKEDEEEDEETDGEEVEEETERFKPASAGDSGPDPVMERIG